MWWYQQEIDICTYLNLILKKENKTFPVWGLHKWGVLIFQMKESLKEHRGSYWAECGENWRETQLHTYPQKCQIRLLEIRFTITQWNYKEAWFNILHIG